MERISKLMSDAHLEDCRLADAFATLDDRCSGDTTGLALMYVGDLMRRDTPYLVSVCGITETLCTDRDLMKIMQNIIHQLGLNHFVFNFSEYTVAYDVWR